MLCQKQSCLTHYHHTRRAQTFKASLVVHTLREERAREKHPKVLGAETVILKAYIHEICEKTLQSTKLKFGFSKPSFPPFDLTCLVISSHITNAGLERSWMRDAKMEQIIQRYLRLIAVYIGSLSAARRPS